MKITRRQLSQIIREAAQQDSVDLANAAIGMIQGWQKKGKDVRDRAKRAQDTVQANKEFNKMRKEGTTVKDEYAKVFLKQVTSLKKRDAELFNQFKSTGEKIKITSI
jgi:hypothetical protein